jgi:hypothetical protein
MLDAVQKGKCRMHWGSFCHVGEFTQAQKSNTGIGANSLGKTEWLTNQSWNRRSSFSAASYKYIV